MRRLVIVLPLCIGLIAALLGAAEPAEQAGDGFVPMWNGKDLTGWVNVNCAPETFFVRDDMIVTTGQPIGYLRTERQYENFIAEFDWMHVPPKPDAVGNSGFFVWADAIPAVGTGYTRGIEVQVLVNLEVKDLYTSQGDIFSIWGATCKPDRPHPKGLERCLPSENRTKGANEWNHYRVIGNDGAIKLEVNGKEVSGVSKCIPRKGYLALESEGSECRFKNLKIKELPSTNPPAKEIAEAAIGFQSIFTGLDLRGWESSPEHKKHWRTSGWGLHYDGKCDHKDPNLWTSKEYGNFEMIVDWHLSGKNKQAANPASAILLRGSDKFQITMGSAEQGSTEIRAGDAAPITVKEKAGSKDGQWNRFRIRVKGDVVNVYLNNKLVLENARLTGLPERGRIGLAHLGSPIELGNLFVRELGKDE
jgi:Domain of Unknown Function (DUF1080)